VPADLILHNAKIATNGVPSFVEAVAIEGEKILVTGASAEVFRHRGPSTLVIDARGRTVIPGLNDSHLHLIRGGLNYNMELRWDGVPSLADALRMLKDQAARTPPPQWVRVVGGWTEFQFAERRMPTLDEINAAAPDTPVFVLHLYDRAILNRAALRAVGYTRDTPDSPGAEIQRDRQGNPTGLLIARPNAGLLYATLAKGPKLPPEYQANSTRQFMRELNRLGVTSVIDAGGGSQNYPEDYQVIEELHRRGEMTVRIAYNLFTQRPKQEFDDFAKWVTMTRPGAGSDFYRMNGAGEMLTFSAADFEDFLEPRPDLPSSLEDELTRVVRLLAENRWPFRMHATYDESITRFLNVFEAVNREVPFNGLRWFFDHAETVTERNLERIKALGGGIAVQDRIAFQGEYFIDRYGRKAAEHAPPIRRMLTMGIPVGAGTDATRVASYNPFVSLYWLVAGKTVGGTALYPEANRLDRSEAVGRYTVGSAWFSGEEDKKGAVEVGKLADLAVLSADYFSVPEEEIKRIESVLTVVGGKVVYGAGEFERLAPPPLPVSPDWSPVKAYGGYLAAQPTQSALAHQCAHPGLLHQLLDTLAEKTRGLAARPGPVGLPCECFAF
jgi:predicted amidohydrolase YtcJ